MTNVSSVNIAPPDLQPGGGLVAFDLRRSPKAVALTTLRYVEDLTHRVKTSFVGVQERSDPVAWLIRTHRGIHRDGDATLIRRGYEVAERMHRGQVRKSGEPYITHPLAR
jgi:hypothetical protein